MKKILLGGAAALLLAGPALAADTQSDAITIQGTADNVCTLTSPTDGGSDVNASIAGSTVTITSIASDTDATLKPATANLSFTGMCNYAHTISLESANSGLVNATTANAPVSGSGAFIQRIGYTATAHWAGQAPQLIITNSNHAGSAGKVGTFLPINGANAGPLTLGIVLDTTTDAGEPVVAGNYSDTFTLQIGAHL